MFSLDFRKLVYKKELVFPVTGHSFMSADRIFGNIEKDIRTREVITSPSEYADIIGQLTTVTELTIQAYLFITGRTVFTKF